jgi:hypothetical protein
VRRYPRRRFPTVERLEDRLVLTSGVPSTGHSLLLLLEEPGFAPMTISDGGTGSIVYNAAYGTFSLNEEVTETNPAIGSGSLAEIAFHTFDISTSAGGTLTITVEGTNYALPAGLVNPLTLTTSTGGVLNGAQGSTASFEGWANADDLSPLSASSTVIPPESTTPGLQGPYATSSFSSTSTASFAAGPGAFSLFCQSVIDLQGPGNAGLSGLLSVPIPPSPPEANISIAPGQVSAVGQSQSFSGVNQPQTFTVTVEENNGTGAGFVPAADQLVSLTLANLDGASTATTAYELTTNGEGQAQVAVTSSTAGEVVANASTDVTLDGVTLARATGDGQAGDSGPATATFADATINITSQGPGAVDEPQTLTVTVLENLGTGAGFVPVGSQPVTLTLTSTDGASAETDSGAPATTFNLTTDANGQAEVTLTSATAGTVIGNASTSFSLDGTTLTRATGDNNAGDGGPVAVSFTASAPVIDVGTSDTVIAAGTIFTRTIGFTSASSAWTVNVDYGDGQTESFSLSPSGATPESHSFDPVTKTFTLSHSYAVAKTYTVTVTVTDSSGQSDTASFPVTVFSAQELDDIVGFAIGVVGDNGTGSTDLNAPNGDVQLAATITNGRPGDTISLTLFNTKPVDDRSDGTTATIPTNNGGSIAGNAVPLAFIDTRATTSSDATVTLDYNFIVPSAVANNSLELYWWNRTLHLWDEVNAQAGSTSGFTITPLPDGYSEVHFTRTYGPDTNPTVTELNGTVFSIAVPVGDSSGVNTITILPATTVASIAEAADISVEIRTTGFGSGSSLSVLAQESQTGLALSTPPSGVGEMEPTATMRANDSGVLQWLFGTEPNPTAPPAPPPRDLQENPPGDQEQQGGASSEQDLAFVGAIDNLYAKPDLDIGPADLLLFPSDATPEAQLHPALLIAAAFQGVMSFSTSDADEPLAGKAKKCSSAPVGSPVLDGEAA